MTPATAATRHSVTARAPGKAILFGEHAINRGQPAIAASVGLFARCTASRAYDKLFHFRSGRHEQAVPPDNVLRVWGSVERYRRAESFDQIRRLASEDYFAPQKYVLGSIFCDAVPQGILLEWSSEVPTHSGLGSGGSAFTSMVAAVDSLFDLNASVEDRAAWAHLGDVVAHGGIASALDTQTSLLGGIIEFSGQGLARGLPFAKPPTLVIGDTGVHAATGDVNGRVRAWLDESPKARMHVFRTVGALSRAAAPALARGDWDELGRLMNLNQLALEKIGVTCPEADRLIAAALDAGALGAKVSGSGGGGIIVALATPATKQDVAAAITAAGGKALTPEVAVPGASVEEGTPPQ